MNAKELAERLNGREYRQEITREECEIAKANGLLVVFGASDDLCELRGVVCDEVGCCGENGTFLVDRQGVLPTWDSLIEDQPTEEEVAEYLRRKQGSGTAAIHWGRVRWWTYFANNMTDRAEFEILRDGERYCLGLVGRLWDASHAGQG